MPDETMRAELLDKTAREAGMRSLLNHGAGSMVWSEGVHGVTQDELQAFYDLAFAAGRASAAPGGEPVAVTETMKDAGEREMFSGVRHPGKTWADRCGDIFEAMLKAAPPAVKESLTPAPSDAGQRALLRLALSELVRCNDVLGGMREAIGSEPVIDALRAAISESEGSSNA